MKVQGAKPISLFIIEKQPNHDGFCLVRFFENAKELSDSLWEYDEYHLELRNTGNLAVDIENNFENYLQAAKDAEPVDEVANLKEEVAILTEDNTTLNEYIASLDEALIQMFEMMAEAE